MKVDWKLVVIIVAAFVLFSVLSSLIAGAKSGEST
jgi:hypothetical protein